MSVEQKNYLKKKKIRKIIIISIQLLLTMFLLILWEVLSRKGIINSFIYSSPTRIVKTIKELLITNNLFNHIWCTLKEVLFAFSLGSIIGLITAIILYEIPIMAKVLEPFLITINSLPKVALGPLIIIIAGANFKSVIIMALLINLIITIVNLYNGFINVDNNKIVLLKSLKASKVQTLRYLILPGSLNIIISSLKINISMTLIGVIMGEFLVSKQGIGYLIIYGTQIFNMNLVMAGILLLIIMSVLIYLAVTYLEKKYQK